MLATAIQRGDSSFPGLITDDFNRASTTVGLGMTPVGRVPWETLRGSWAVRNLRAYVATNERDPITVVNARTADVVASVNVSSSSGDGLAFRVKDANNYLRASYHYDSSTSPSYRTEYSYICITIPVKLPWQTTWHDHDRKCWNTVQQNCCTRGVTSGTLHSHGSYGTHGDELAIAQETRLVLAGSSTSYTRRVYLDKIEHGVVTTLGFWNSSNPGALTVAADGNNIRVYQGAVSTDASDPTGGLTRLGGFTTSFNQTETKHGLARRMGGRQGTALDNFILIKN